MGMGQEQEDDTQPVNPADQLDSLVRPRDVTDYSLNSSARYNNREMALQSQIAAAQQSGENYLRQSQNRKADLSTGNDIAGALLAAVPTIGGALIGSAVGRPTLPQGVYGLDMSKYNVGAGAGLAQGAALGDQTSQNYFKNLDAQAADKADVAAQLAKFQLAQADKLQGSLDSTTSADLQSQASLENQKEMAKINYTNQLNLQTARQNADKAVDPRDIQLADALTKANGDISKVPDDLRNYALTSKGGGQVLERNKMLGPVKNLDQQAQELRIEVQRDKEVMNYQAMKGIVGAAQRYSSLNTPQAAQFLMEMQAKTANPTGVMRSEVLKQNLDARSLMNKLGGAINQNVFGGSFLTDSDTQNSLQAMQTKLEQTRDLARDKLTATATQAEEKGIPLNKVFTPSQIKLLNGEDDMETAPTVTPSSSSTSSSSVPTVGGMFNGGKVLSVVRVD